MSPDDGLIIYSELRIALKNFALDTELHCIYEITPINVCDQWSQQSLDWTRFQTIFSNLPEEMSRVAHLVGIRENFIMNMMKQKECKNKETQLKMFKIHTRFYTALILYDLVNEEPFSKVLGKYGCHKGKIFF